MEQYITKSSKKPLNHFTDFLVSKALIEFIFCLTLFLFKEVGFVERLVRKYSI